jgi:hypothetical protein
MKFARIFSDFVENAETLQLLEISRFQFDFYHDYPGYSLNFRLNFRFNFNLIHRAAPQWCMNEYKNSPRTATRPTQQKRVLRSHDHVASTHMYMEGGG